MFVNEMALEEGSSPCSLAVKRRSTFLIVDWDDTLLPTSWLTKNDLMLDAYLIPDTVREELRKIDQAVVEFLRKASVLYGKVMIITNAQPQWIEFSSQKFLPDTHQLLFSSIIDDSDVSVCSYSSSSSAFRNLELNLGPAESVGESSVQNTVQVADTDDECNIKMFSARELFEKDFPDDPSAWKRTAFKKLLKARISSKFFINSKSDISRSHSVSGMTHKDLPSENRGLKRSLSAISLSTNDINGLIELESESYEVETEFKDNDSFFSLDFSAIDESQNVELEWESSINSSSEKKDVPTGIGIKSEMEFCNLLSIGDCSHDTQSLAQLEIGLDPNRTLLKTVKLVEFPTIQELWLEVEGLSMCLDKVVRAKKSFNLFVDRSKLI